MICTLIISLNLKSKTPLHTFNFLSRTLIRSGPISGRAHHGRVHAIISHDEDLASALLHTLAYSQPPSGWIKYFGHPRPKDWGRRIGFVPKADFLSGKLTPKEVIHDSVGLCCNRQLNREEREKRVMELLEFNGLSEVQDKKILRLGRPGALELVTRKRIIIAKETTHSPKVLFVEGLFDGLDRTEAIQLLSLLESYATLNNSLVMISMRRLTREATLYISEFSIVFGRTLICTCNKEQLLRAVDLCCEGTNFEQKLVTLNRMLLEAFPSPASLQERNRFFAHFKDSLDGSNSTIQSAPIIAAPYEWPAPWWITFYYLLRFQLREDLRSRKYVLGMISTNFVVYMLLSFVFFQLPDTEDGLTDRVGLLYFLNINILFTTSLSRMVRLEHAFHHFRGDRKVRLFQSASFIFGQFFASIPLRTLLFIVLGSALYYITGLNSDGFEHYIVFMADLILFSYSSLALGMLVAVCVPRLQYGQVVMPFIVVICFIFGNLSTAPDATWILRWIQYISPVFYSFQCLIQNELDGMSLENGADVEFFLTQGLFNVLPIAACLPALAGFTIIYLLLAVIAYHFRFRPLRVN